MYDQSSARSYEPDTTVIDTDDELDDMHVNVDGAWCRDLLGSTDRTACDKPYRFTITQRRRPVLDGALCPDCFTPREVIAAQEAADKARAEADGFVGINPRRR